MRAAAVAVVGLLALFNSSANASDDNRVRTQLVAEHAVTIASELSATIAKLPLAEGEAFRKGQKLVEFECSSYRAQLQKAQASADAARQLLKVNQRLVELDSIGQLEVAQAEGRAKETAAEVAYVQTLVAKCVINAPFDGRVASRPAAEHQYLNPGDPVIAIVDTRALELRLIVPSSWLQWLKIGHKFKVTLDDLGRTFDAHVERLGATIDPVSQSLTVIAKVDDNEGVLLPGMSGWAELSPPAP